MRLLLDTHILLWAAAGDKRLSRQAAALLNQPSATLMFSVASLWEITIKRALRRDDFRVDPRGPRRGMLESGYQELPVSGSHVLALATLPQLHKVPFDRLLLAQAQHEDMALVTSDPAIARYEAQVIRV